MYSLFDITWAKVYLKFNRSYISCTTIFKFPFYPFISKLFVFKDLKSCLYIVYLKSKELQILHIL